jgi:xanthine dehydrogenase/oxidase
MEELLIDTTDNSGALISNGTWEYKIPSTKDIPIDWRVSLLKNSNNPLGILGSKAVGEPPLALSCALLFAAKYAVAAARYKLYNFYNL